MIENVPPSLGNKLLWWTFAAEDFVDLKEAASLIRGPDILAALSLRPFVSESRPKAKSRSSASSDGSTTNLAFSKP